MKKLGTKISREKAIKIANQILKKAEKERIWSLKQVLRNKNATI